MCSWAVLSCLLHKALCMTSVLFGFREMFKKSRSLKILLSVNYLVLLIQYKDFWNSYFIGQLRLHFCKILMKFVVFVGSKTIRPSLPAFWRHWWCYYSMGVNSCSQKGNLFLLFFLCFGVDDSIQNRFHFMGIW